MSTFIELTCKNCKKKFEYSKKEFNRQSKIGRSIGDFACSISCSITYRNKNLTEDQRKAASIRKSQSNIGNSYNKKGEFTYYLSKAKSRDPNMNIDEEYLQKLWDEQQQRCALSKIEIHLKNGKHKLDTASLDRINSSKGYIKNNVQFVAYAINLAKNNFRDEDVHQLLKCIVESY